MCLNDVKKETLECSEDGDVLEIHEAYIGQDLHELFKCFKRDVSIIQNPCKNYPDKIADTKLKCDGRRSCSLRGSLEVPSYSCPDHLRYFHVEFSCKANETEGVVSKAKKP